ncbi:putative mRNA 3-end processing factor [Methanohalophilus levihalophilus]|nr:putative mRNA 3-end processing factor [Methanohalophilus levihalophilus]
MDKLIEMGLLVYRQKNSRGGFKPHIGLKFRSKEGDVLSFVVDTTRTPQKYPQPDAYLITHAHSDHHGSSAMRSERAACTEKTAKALELRHGKNYEGNLVTENGEGEIADVKVRTYSTGHTEGSVAFGWENENGVRILVTGDVKDASNLPKCDVLITEANYGDPGDPFCHFKDDLEAFEEVLFSEERVAFGAYSFGKAQRAVQLIRQMGYEGPISMESTSLELTRSLTHEAGELVDIGMSEKVSIVPPHHLGKLSSSISKYVLSARQDHPFPSVCLSDHLDAPGLVDMVEQIDPEAVVVYHPTGHRPSRFASHLCSLGFEAISTENISNVLSNEFL